MAKAQDHEVRNGSDKLGDISARLQDLDSRIKAERNEQAAVEAASIKYKGVGDYSKAYRLVSEFVAGIVVGAGLGLGLDYLFNSRPLFLIIFLLAGFSAGIVNMSRSANRAVPSAEELAKMPKISDDDDDIKLEDEDK